MRSPALYTACWLLALASLAPAVQGLKCYACVQSGNEDTKCEKDPKQVPNSVINCNKKYCVIRRIEFVDQPNGKVFSFYRGCEQRPDYINSEITDSQFKTYYRSCTTDLCNNGNGRSSSGGGSGGGLGGGGDSGVIIVPGMGNTATPLTLWTVPALLLPAIMAALLK